MDFINELRSTFLKKGLSTSSINNYINNLRLLNNGKDYKDIKFLTNIEKINEKLEDKSENTKRNYYIAIVSVLNALKTNKKKLNKLFDYYYSKMMELNKQQKQIEEQHIKTEQQEKNWIEWPEIVNKLNELKNIVQQFPPTIDEAQYNEVLKMIVLSLYVLHDPRRNQDYQLMDISMNPSNSSDRNYLKTEEGGSGRFLFRSYKTCKTELKNNQLIEKVIEIKPELMDNIKLYLNYHPLIKGFNNINHRTNIIFLVNHKGEGLKFSNSITYILNSIFKKNIGASMLRHIYLSSLITNEDLEKTKRLNTIASNMSHSVGMQKDYVKI